MHSTISPTIGRFSRQSSPPNRAAIPATSANTNTQAAIQNDIQQDTQKARATRPAFDIRDDDRACAAAGTIGIVNLLTLLDSNSGDGSRPAAAYVPS